MTGFLFFAGAVLLVMAVGFALHIILKNSPLKHNEVTRTEWVVGTLVASFVVIPVVTFAGSAIAKSNATTYHEYWSGLEKAANVQVTTCTKDGPCVHEYNCDPYVVMVTKTRQVPYTTTETYTDANGKVGTRTVTKYRTETYTEPETRYHDCPYVEKEYTFTVTDTMDKTYTFGSHWFPKSPEDYRWVGSGYERRSLPSVPTGEPKQWLEAKARIDAGNPGGTTQRHNYKNYILASSEDIYEKFSSSIEDYSKAGLLPKVQTKVYDEYRSDKLYFVGDKPSDSTAWQVEVQRLNGHLGSERQGDLHVVLVTSDEITDLDNYTQALEAYWQSDKLERDTLSKNGVGLVIKLDSTGSTVEEARGFTGMPMGNEALVQTFPSLEGTEATPEALFAKTGAVGALLFDEANGFTRVEMANYEYLADSIQIGTGARILILLVAVILSMGIWGLMFAIDLRFHPIENFREFFGKGKGEDEGDETPEDTLNRYRSSGYSPDWK